MDDNVIKLKNKDITKSEEYVVDLSEFSLKCHIIISDVYNLKNEDVKHHLFENFKDDIAFNINIKRIIDIRPKNIEIYCNDCRKEFNDKNSNNDFFDMSLLCRYRSHDSKFLLTVEILYKGE